MQKKSKTTLGISLIITLLISVLSTGMAFAAEGDQIDLTGYIIELNPEDGTIVIDVDGDILTTEDVYTVLVGDNFNFDNHLVGDLITLQGTIGEDDVISVTELKIMERAKDQIKLQDGELDSYYCANEEQSHPVAVKIAETYGVDYSVIEGYLCAEPSIPLGQIMLALQTADQLEGVDFTSFLDGFENSSWGQIWQDMDLQGKPDKGTPPGQVQDKQGEEDGEGNGPKGKGNKDGSDELLECEEGDFFCEAYGWLQSQTQKGKK